MDLAPCGAGFGLCSLSVRRPCTHNCPPRLWHPPLLQMQECVVFFEHLLHARPRGESWLQELSPVLEEPSPETGRVMTAGNASGWVPGAQIIRA